MKGSPGHLLIIKRWLDTPAEFKGEEFIGEPAAPDGTKTWKQLKKIESGGFSSFSLMI